MKKLAFRKYLPLLVAVLAVFTLSACNRGVGCPSNFGLGNFLYEALTAVLSILF